MIVFHCAHCAHQFSVKEEFAGRQTRCPTCQQPLVVPPTDRNVAHPVDAPLDGPASSLAQAGFYGTGLTLGQPHHPLRSDPPPLAEVLARGAKTGARYLLQDEIARGGMGAVLRAVDGDIRREVAVKYLLDQDDPIKMQRFVEEAQITGQLEHPNIVPVHELGLDSQKRLFFSMKMVRGRSLAQVIGDLRDSSRLAEREWPLSRLLTILVNVCHALAYAHARGVIHRDLKPANIMIGDFGEVYVMDWGLAKVLDGTGQPESSSVPPRASLPAFPFDPGSSASSSSKIDTNREPDANLTQEGTIMGTLVYMPPEQAAGQIHALDPRSDVYSLGGILYEILTLQPPMELKGGNLAILKRVTEGQIIPPEQREPGRARAGKIPRELAAVAIKALARSPDQRYQSVEELRRDLERFTEGRSVSAKHDSLRELLWKFVKRHKGFSAAAAAGLVLLLGSLAVIAGAWWETGRAYARFQAEQQDKHQRTRAAVPAFLRAARLAINERQHQDALEHAIVAVDYAPDNADAHLLKGQLLIVQQQFPEARVELNKCLGLRPAEVVAAKLVKLLDKASPGDAATCLSFADLFTEQRAYGLADGVLQGFGPNALEAQNRILALYRKRIEGVWPGLGGHLHLGNDNRFSLILNSTIQVNDLGPLQGIPLFSLNLGSCRLLRDLTPLRGMPLTTLSLQECTQVSDLTPLRGLPLTSLHLSQGNQLRDLTPLQDLHLTSLSLGNCTELSDLRPLHGLPLTSLNLVGCGQVRDLTPLQGLPLTTLSLGQIAVQDLTPLQGLPLTMLSLSYCLEVNDLKPLHGLPLTFLDLNSCRQVKDLTPLRGMRLQTLNLEGCAQIKDLGPLQGMPLNKLTLTRCAEVGDLTPLRGLPLTSLGLGECKQVRDLTPLQGINLIDIHLNPRTVTQGLDVLR